MNQVTAPALLEPSLEDAIAIISAVEALPRAIRT